MQPPKEAVVLMLALRSAALFAGACSMLFSTSLKGKASLFQRMIMSVAPDGVIMSVAPDGLQRRDL
jgi:hypothetical protein